MNPRVGVGVFILNNKGQFVLGQRKGSHGAGTWALPGGHLEFGESFETCAAREVLEETGLEVRDIHFLTATNDIMKDEEKHYVTVFVGCTVVGDDAQPKLLEPHKCEQWKWVTWEEIGSYDRGVAEGEASNGRLFMPLVNLFKQRPGFNPTESY
ncbi:NUDIX hydrolase domain-like protein [Aspergillus avenaceus]|uniref:NUDIX hydrolase domain-like protein n=1 Tax=Aspergillus avenaceus TaxID=36643 RepID=A0A5N6TJV2_ASPAV|nr:NUDIX hydrolase domain-like protein [Aspergillus avenaceus]